MAKPYDATTKELLERHPADWLAFAGLPQAAVRVVDADLSSFTFAADKVIWVDAPMPYILHVEFQAGPDAALDPRMLLYNVVLRWRHEVPVRTVVILLRREAQLSSMTGHYSDRAGPGSPLDFHYSLIRAWELPPAQVLAGGLGTLPLAPLTSARREELPEIIGRMRRRLQAEAPRQQAMSLMTAAYILTGLRYPPDVVDELYAGVHEMEESSTYQAILERGRAEEARAAVILAGRGRLGQPDPRVVVELGKIRDVSRLEFLIERAGTIASWDELLCQ